MTCTVAGMISGTSYDAVDVAVAEFRTDDHNVLHCRPLGLHSRPVDPQLRAAIAAVLPPNPTSIEQICRLDTELGQLFGEVAVEAIMSNGPVDLIASHGQTVFHWVEGNAALGTLQLGSPAWIAEATGTPVLSDLRTRDIARGGHGAPLASTMDALLLLDQPGRRGALNLGGIANLTVRDDQQQVISYDIGPANALTDAAVSDATQGRLLMDQDGAHAAQGEIDPGLLERLLADPYYRLPPPKSTGKEHFHLGYLTDSLGTSGIGLNDLLATLTELTARLVAAECRRYGLSELVVSGGGIANPALMARITALAAPTTTRPIDDFGLPAQAKEGYLMALLGFLSWHSLPGTITSATGAQTLLGSLTPGAGPLLPPAPLTEMPARMIIES